MAFRLTTLFLPLIYIWRIEDVSAYYRDQYNDPMENVYLHRSVVPSNNNFLKSKYIVFPSSQRSTDNVKFIHSLTAAAPLVSLADDDIRDIFDQRLRSTEYKKTPKYSKYTARIKLKPFLKTDVNDKNCCGDGWPWLTSKNNAFPYSLMQQPLRPTYYPSNQDYGYRAVDDVKPVVEHIEGDLKYDFRTGTHSF